jgi:glycine hydroxymethyltransferase
LTIDRSTLLRSLSEQRRQFADSIVLTPVDSLPFSLADREHTAFLHGLYLTDKLRGRDRSRSALILFGGRDQASRDLADIHSLLAEALGAAEGSLRLLAGLQAHTATFMSISSIGQSVLLLSDEAGGHFSTRAILERLGLRAIDVPIDYERLCVDRAATLALVQRERPDFVFVDRSEGLRYEDFSFLGALDGPVKVFDASQFLTPILTGHYENPLAWGFDLMLFTLHKSFPGPQKAGIVGRERGELWERLLAGLGTLVSSSHVESSYLTALTLLRADWLRRYAARLLDSAAELELRLSERGVSVVPRSRQGDPTWPATHHIWIETIGSEAAFGQYERLAAANVQVNYRKLPYRLGYGLRLGTSHSATAGVDVPHMAELADIVALAIDDAKISPVLRERVRALAVEAQVGAILPTAHWC